VLHHFFTTDTLEPFVVQTVNCGEDADTTGAIAGMLGGALYGVGEIPLRWLYKLDSKVQGLVRAQVEALLHLAG
jgi:ADP-ribosyl-[dinitrogen reductase] hydrolase